MHATTLLSRYPLISDQVDTKELSVVLDALESQLRIGTEGNIVEFGCYVGTTSLFLRRLLDIYKSSREFHVYDSFIGLPDKGEADKSPAGEQFKRGELAVSKKDFLLQFKKAGLRPPVVHKAWFSDIEKGEVPDGITFAFLDGDYYESVMTPLSLIWEKCLPGAVIIVDDYANEALPGAAKAVNDWLQSHPASLRVQYSLAIISPRTS